MWRDTEHRTHQTVCYHLSVCNHNSALILLLLQQSQRGCLSEAVFDELAAPCQLPPEVFSFQQTDLPKSEGIALEMCSSARCFQCCLFTILLFYLFLHVR